jgi:hypothetical protein
MISGIISLSTFIFGFNVKNSLENSLLLKCNYQLLSQIGMYHLFLFGDL